MLKSRPVKLSLLFIFLAGTVLLLRGAYEKPAPAVVDLAEYVYAGDSGNLPIVVALRMGYFKEEGLDVRVRVEKRDQDPAGDPDILLMGRSKFYGGAAAAPGIYKAFFFGLQDKAHSTDAIVVRSDIKAERLKDVAELASRGEIPYLGGGAACEAALRMVLRENGIDPEKISTPHISGSDFSDLEKRNWPVAYLREPFLSHYLDKGSYRVLIDGPVFSRRVFSPWPMTVGAFSRRFAAERPDLAARAVTAVDRALAFIRKNPARAEAMLAEHAREATGFKGIRPRNTLHLGSGEVPASLVQRQSDWYFDNNLINARVEAASLFYDRSSVRADKELRKVVLTSTLDEGEAAYALHLVGWEKGFFRAAGIDLVYRLGGPEISEKDPLPPSDLYVMGRSRVYLNEALFPGSLKIFNANVQEEGFSDDAVVVRKGLGVGALGRPGKGPVALVGGGPARVPMMRHLLSDFTLEKGEHSLKAVDVKSVDRPAQLDALLKGTEVAYARDPFLGLLLSGGGWETVVGGPLFSRTEFSPWPMSMTLFSSEFLNKDPELAKKLAGVYDRIISYIRENPSAARAILSEYAGKRYGAKTLDVRLLNYLKAGEIQPAVIQKQADWYFDNGIVRKRLDAGRLLLPETLKARPADTKKTDSVRIFYIPKPGKPDIFPFYVAEEKGFLREAGLALERVYDMDYSDPARCEKTHDAMMTGRSVIYGMEINSPGHFKAVASTYEDEENNTWAILARKGSGFGSLADLKGKRIGLERFSGETNLHLMKLILRNNGLEPRDFSLTEAVIGDLAAGKVDALYIREPQLALALLNPDIAVLVEKPLLRYVINPTPMSFLSFSSRFIKERPEAARKLAAVWERSIDFIRKNPAAVREIYYRKMKEAYGADLRGRPLRTMKHWKRGEIRPELLQQQIDLYHKIGFLKGRPKIDDVLMDAEEYRRLLDGSYGSGGASAK